MAGRSQVMYRDAYAPFDLRTIYDSKPFSGENLGVKLSKTGPVNWAQVRAQLEAHGIPAKDANWAMQIDQGRRQLNNNDLRLQYNNQIVPLNIQASITSTQLNQRNAFIYRVLIPIEVTDEFNFSSSDYELYMAPFDEVSPFNVGRETGYRKTVQQVTLKMYKRVASAEYTLLADKVHGPIAMRRMAEQIDKHGELTLIVLGANFLVEFPAYQLLKKYQHPTNGFSHAREIISMSKGTYGAADHGSAYLTQMLQQFNSTNQIDSVVVPQGTGRYLIKNEGEPKPVEGYVPVYQQGVSGTLLIAYANGAQSFRSLTHGNGAQVNFFELEPMKGYHDDPDGMSYRPLEQVIILGEWITHPNQLSLTDLSSPLAAKGSKFLDIGAIDQSPTLIERKLLRYRDYLKANVLFLNYNSKGGYLGDVNATLSKYVQDVVERYNKDPDLKHNFMVSVRDPEHLDNNAASPNYHSTPIKAMLGFRHFCPWVSYDDVQKKVIMPKYFGDLEPKTLHPDYAWGMAEVLTRAMVTDGSSLTGLVTDAASAQKYLGELRAVLQNSNLTEETERKKIKNDTDLKDLLNSESPATGSAGHIGQPDPLYGKDPTDPKNVHKEKFRFRLPDGSLMLPLKGETKQVYLGRVTPEAIQKEIGEAGLHAPDSGWLHLLQHVPDSGLSHFLGLVYLTHKDGREADHMDSDSLSALSEQLAEQSGKPHVNEMLSRAVRFVEAKPAHTIGQTLKTRGVRSWYTEDKLAELNQEAKGARLSNQLAQHVRAHVGKIDAMDIDGPAVGRLGNIVTGLDTQEDVEIQDPADATKTIKAKFLEQVKGRHSWKHFNDNLRTHAASPMSVRLTYVALMQSRFNWFTCDQLSAFGIAPFRQNYMRWQIEQVASSFSACAAGQCAFMAVGHGQVLSATDAHSGAFSLVGQFHAGVVPTGGARNMMYFPHAFPREHRAGRNLMPITMRAHLSQYWARDRRSVIVLPTPVTEDEYEYPISVTREPVFIAPDERAPMANQKTSITDLLRAFVGEDIWDDLTLDADHLSQYFTVAPRVATHLHRAFAGSCLSNDPNEHQWVYRDGTGPLGFGRRNTPEDVDAYMGLGSFSQKFDPISVH